MAKLEKWQTSKERVFIILRDVEDSRAILFTMDGQHSGLISLTQTFFIAVTSFVALGGLLFCQFILNVTPRIFNCP